MKRILLIALSLLPLVSSAQANKQVDLTQYVNPLMGTASKPIMSNGNTYPAIAVPWGMNFWTPQTGKMGSGWQIPMAPCSFCREGLWLYPSTRLASWGT